MDKPVLPAFHPEVIGTADRRSSSSATAKGEPEPKKDNINLL